MSDVRALFLATGCLSEAGLDVLMEAPLGRTPPEVASHISMCPSCQARLLAGHKGPGLPPRGATPTAPPLWRAIAIAAAAVLLLVSILLTLRRLTTPIP